MTTTRRTETEAERREQILTAARKVFREKGYDATTVADIVAEAGVAQGTFYLYFPSKKDAVISLAVRVLDELARLIPSALQVAFVFGQEENAAQVQQIMAKILSSGLVR